MRTQALGRFAFILTDSKPTLVPNTENTHSNCKSIKPSTKFVKFITPGLGVQALAIGRSIWPYSKNV